ncbi:MAG TPA: FAD-binding protein, partial [Bacillota bacterium]|nr:FAD-binding protein [Bacillota bacterium]
MILLNKQDMYESLISLTDADNVIRQKPLKSHTYTRLGGNADFFVTPRTYKEVQEIVKLANKADIPFTLLGNGSNLIIKDGGIRGIVLNLKQLDSITVHDTKIVAGSGALIIHTSEKALEANLTGLEFACGIPGSVGGALFMNAGAYGGEIKDVLESAIVVDKNGELLELRAEDLDLEYRSSNIPDNEYIVLEATFLLQEGNHQEIKAVMDDLTYKRESKQPLEYPS